MEKKSIWIYLAFVFAISWPFLFAGTFFDDSIKKFVLNGLGMLSVGLVTISYARWAGESLNPGYRFGKMKYYLYAVLFCLAVWAFPMAIDVVLGHRMVSPLPNALLSSIVFFIAYPFFGFGAELGFRGYLLPRLMYLGKKKAVLVHGFLWGIWQLPVVVPMGVRIMLNQGFSSSTFSAWLIVGSIFIATTTIIISVFLGIVFAWFWFESGSIFNVSFLHGFNDALRDSLYLWIIGAGAIVTGFLPTAIIVICALMLFLRMKDLDIREGKA